MSTNTELFNLQLIVTGKEEAEDLKAKISLTEQKIASLWSTMKGNPTAFRQAIKADIVVLNDLQTKLKETQSKISGLSNTKGAGQALGQIGYAVDDLQYGFKGISNNIQPILSSIPALAGLAGPISIAAIATYQLWAHWDKLMDLMGTGLPQPALTGPELLAANLKKATTEMEELQKKSRLTWYEVERLNKLRDDVKSMKQEEKNNSKLENMLEGQSEQQKEYAGAFTKALNEAGPKNALDELKHELEGQKDAKGQVFNPVTRSMTTPDKAAGDLIRSAGEGDISSRDEIRKTLKPNSSFLKEINDKSPETKAANDKADAEGDRIWEESQESIKKMQDGIKKRNEQAKNIAGDSLKGANADKFLSGRFTDEDVNKELSRRGLRTDDPLLRNQVTSSIKKQADEMGAEEATRRGLASPQEGKDSLRNTLAQKAIDDREKALKDRVGNVTEANPELPKLLSTSIEGSMRFGGKSLEQAQASLFGDLSSKFGEDVAKSLVDKAGGEAQKGLASDYLKEGMPKSENATILNGSSSLRDSLQSAVKSPEYDLLQKQLTEYQKATLLLQEIKEKKSGGLG